MKMSSSNKVTPPLVAFFTLLLIGQKPALSEETDKPSNISGSVSMGIGGQHINNDAAMAGMYTGINSSELFFLGGLDLQGRWNEKYLNINTNTYGFDSNEIKVRQGVAGLYDIRFKRLATPWVHSVNARTPFSGVGSNQLSLANGFEAGESTSEMSNLSSNLNSLSIGTERSDYDLSFAFTPTDKWRLALDLKRKEKEGTLPIGGALGSSGRFTASAILPAPVDYVTHEIGSSISYRDNGYFVKAGYQFSRFNNKNHALTWDNPFKAPGGAPYPSQGRLALTPDNDLHRFSFQAGATLPLRTRLSMLVEHSLMRQNESLLPYTINPRSTEISGLPRQSAEAEVDVTRFTVNLSSRPFNKLAMNMKFHHYSTNNNTPTALFTRVSNDTGDQGETSSSKATYNPAYELSKNNMAIDGNYYFTSRTALKLGYKFDTTERNNRAVKDIDEHTWHALFRTRFNQYISGNMKYAFSTRQNDGYDASQVYSSTHTQSYINSVRNPQEQFDTHPELRQMDIADRYKHDYGLNLNIVALDNLAISLLYHGFNEDYFSSTIGLTSNDNHSVTLDFSYVPTTSSKVFWFVTQDFINQELNGRGFRGGKPGTALSTSQSSKNNWQADSDDKITTIGFGGNIANLMNDKLSIKTKYTFSYSSNDITLSSKKSISDFPENTTHRHTLSLEGSYQYSKPLTLSLGMLYESFETDDWARDGISAGSTQVKELLTMIGKDSDYDALQFFMRASYEF